MKHSFANKGKCSSILWIGVYSPKVIKGLAFLTGIGKDKVLDEIEAQLRK